MMAGIFLVYSKSVSLRYAAGSANEVRNHSNYKILLALIRS